ncbi:MAG: helix-turn-helix transcriptional regulator [Treponema sp.]|nr:helix-turn-helix transcriptional regulator [Treponema sp.]
MGVRQIFRENLKHYRKAKGLSQEKLSELIGYGGTYITEIESRHKFPKPETIDIIAKKLEVEPYLLFKPLEQANIIEEKNADFSMALQELKSQMDELFTKTETRFFAKPFPSV